MGNFGLFGLSFGCTGGGIWAIWAYLGPHLAAQGYHLGNLGLFGLSFGCARVAFGQFGPIWALIWLHRGSKRLTAANVFLQRYPFDSQLGSLGVLLGLVLSTFGVTGASRDPPGVCAFGALGVGWSSLGRLRRDLEGSQQRL